MFRVGVDGREQVGAEQRHELLRAAGSHAVDGAEERQRGPPAPRSRWPRGTNEYLAAVRGVRLPSTADVQDVLGLDSQRDIAQAQRHDAAVGVGLEDREAL